MDDARAGHLKSYYIERWTSNIGISLEGVILFCDTRPDWKPEGLNALCAVLFLNVCSPHCVVVPGAAKRPLYSVCDESCDTRKSASFHLSTKQLEPPGAIRSI